MKTWMIILLIGLVLVALLFGGAGAWITNANLESYKSKLLIPFSQKLDPNNPSYLTEVKDGAGNNQLTCPPGSKINVVGAIYEVADSYGQCSTSPSSAVAASCNPDIPSNVACDPDKNNTSTGTGGSDLGSNPGCPSGWTCNPTSKTCSLRTFSSLSAAQSVCKDPNIVPTQGENGGWSCIDDNICDPNRTLPNGQNTVCNPQSGKGKCAVRDVSAYISGTCDGQQTCNLDFTKLGPVPCAVNLPSSASSGGKGCNISVDSTGKVTINNVSDEYCDLPFNNGFPSPGSQGGTPSSSSATLGYVVHGIYTCVSD